MVGENLRKFSWLTGLAFDLKTDKVIYTPIASEKQVKGKVPEEKPESPEAIKEANRKQVVGRTVEKMERIKGYREILKLKKTRDNLEYELL